VTPPGGARLEARVRGRVQGVGFRYFVVETARQLGLTGWVANQADGSVALVAEGQRAPLEELLHALHRGPAGADVQQVSAAWPLPTGRLEGFSIRSSGHPGD
jgi:acylphosphatase